MSSKYYHTQRQSSSIKGLLTPLGSWDSHFSRHQPIIPSSEPSPFKGIFPKNRWSWKLFTLHSSLIPALEGRNLFLILQESQTPLFQCGRILSSLLDIPRPVPLYYISCLLGSVCGVDFLLGYLYFPSTMYRPLPPPPRGDDVSWTTLQPPCAPSRLQPRPLQPQPPDACPRSAHPASTACAPP